MGFREPHILLLLVILCFSHFFRYLEFPIIPPQSPYSLWVGRKVALSLYSGSLCSVPWGTVLGFDCARILGWEYDLVLKTFGQMSYCWNILHSIQDGLSDVTPSKPHDLCYFYAPLKAEASANLALALSAKILYTAPIPLWCVWLLDGSTRKPQQHHHLSIHTYKCSHTHTTSQNQDSFSSVDNALTVSLFYTFFSVPLLSRIFCLYPPPPYICPTSSLNFAT